MTFEAPTRGLVEATSFPGFIENLHAIIPTYDNFAFSSDTEQMPLSIIEAMAAGLPVASLDVGDVRRMVARENRNSVRGRALSDLTSSLALLLGDCDARTTLGAVNKRLAEREFDGRRMFVSWKELFTHG